MRKTGTGDESRQTRTTRVFAYRGVGRDAAPHVQDNGIAQVASPHDAR
jgi:hypothetical protein